MSCDCNNAGTTCNCVINDSDTVTWTGAGTPENPYAASVADSPGMPLGSITMYPVATPPTGWLVANGQAVSRVTYADLFGLIDVDYGPGNGSTTFNVPDFGSRFPVGAENPDYPLASTGGAATHTLTVAEMPAHDHGTDTSDDGSHVHNYDGPIGLQQVQEGTGQTLIWQGQTDTDTDAAGVHDHTIASEGDGDPHNNIPPYLGITFIIKHTI